MRGLLKAEQRVVNPKKTYRLYAEEGLQVRTRRRKRSQRPRTPLALPNQVNERWSMDFVSDQLADGRRFRVLNIIDDYSRECIGQIVDTSISGIRVARYLSERCQLRARPATIVTDNVLTVESSTAVQASVSEAALNVLDSLRSPLSKDGRGLPRPKRSPDLTIVNTRSGSERPRLCLKQHGVPWKARTLSTGS